MSETIVFTSGKGGVGKTTCIANIGVGLSLLDKKVLMIDCDMGLRNLDIVMGLENRIRYHILDLLEQKCSLKQAIIHDRRFDNLYMIPGTLKVPANKNYEMIFSTIISKLKQEYDYILIDCPAGIDAGFRLAVSCADSAFLITTPHISAIRDAGRTLYALDSYHTLNVHLFINQYDSKMVRKKEMISMTDIEEILDMKAFYVIPSDRKMILSQNKGIPIISYSTKTASAYLQACQKIIKTDLNVHNRKGYSYEAISNL